MKDRALASRKIEEKERLKKAIIAQYRQLTSGIPDVRNYSKVPPLEKAAALIGRAKRKIQKHATIYEERTNEELAAEVAQLEAQGVAADERRRAALSRLPLRPAFFRDRVSRYSWIVKFEIAGGHLSPEDEAFKAEYEAGMSKEESEYWNTVTELSKKDLEVKA